MGHIWDIKRHLLKGKLRRLMFKQALTICYLVHSWTSFIVYEKYMTI